MKPSACLAASLLALGCTPSGDSARSVGREPQVLSEADLARARALPSFALAEIVVDGESLYGTLGLQIVEDTEEVSLWFAGSTADSSVGINGSFDLGRGLAPASLPAVIAFDRTADIDWLLENRGWFRITSTAGADTSYGIRAASFRIQADGLFAAEIRGVDRSRVDLANQRILSGDDYVVTATGRLTGGCLTRRPDGPQLFDPSDGDPLCAALFSGL